jgi:hypothetical protein
MVNFWKIRASADSPRVHRRKCDSNENQNDCVGSDALKFAFEFAAAVLTRWKKLSKTSRRF